MLSDGGGEVIKSTVKNVLEKSRTSSRMSMPYTPQQNGAAERKQNYCGKCEIYDLCCKSSIETVGRSSKHVCLCFEQNRANMS
ncbi:hypothetical protein TNCT_383781 [Trichonephila clavata]|uniref:Integrase catalytic domain-containing protein n=1 Tax=Trichonephila clavata TaxID=2740835 RepID=A0A8X6HCT5_TRICU|nr:hypothetical protein TNCT_383781 [Trichonephila clavata]